MRLGRWDDGAMSARIKHGKNRKDVEVDRVGT
jgi:hypothetical protein